MAGRSRTIRRLKSAGPSERLWDENRLRSPHDQGDKGRRVRAMFDAIAPTYEFINTVFSAGRDRSWRRRAVSMAAPRPDDRVLDIACGTGNFARAFLASSHRPRKVVGCDFAEAMLRQATLRGAVGIEWLSADAMHLPFASDSFTILCCAFGVRNFQDLDAGLREMHRVLAPGGRIVILEFSRPENRLQRILYETYASKIMPLGAAFLSRDRTGAYRYLPRSVVSFPHGAALRERLADAGFSGIVSKAMTFGVVTSYLGVKNGDGDSREDS